MITETILADTARVLAARKRCTSIPARARVVPQHEIDALAAKVAAQRLWLQTRTFWRMVKSSLSAGASSSAASSPGRGTVASADGALLNTGARGSRRVGFLPHRPAPWLGARARGSARGSFAG